MRKLGVLTVAVASVMAIAGVASICSASGEVSKTAEVGPYAVTLKLLPAESFSGSGAEMTWDGGARPVQEGGAGGPNHHLVVFVERDGKPVTDAKVDLRYRRLKPAETKWQELPVARMHVRGKGVETTHYGNNLKLDPGRYAVEIEVNGRSTTLRFES